MVSKAAMQSHFEESPQRYRRAVREKSRLNFDNEGQRPGIGVKPSRRSRELHEDAPQWLMELWCNDRSSQTKARQCVFGGVSRGNAAQPSAALVIGDPLRPVRQPPGKFAPMGLTRIRGVVRVYGQAASW